MKFVRVTEAKARLRIKSALPVLSQKAELDKRKMPLGPNAELAICGSVLLPGNHQAKLKKISFE